MDRTPEQRALAGKTYEQITEDPESHDQKAYGTQDECGTRHCVAGWAARLAHPDWEIDWLQSTVENTSYATKLIKPNGEFYSTPDLAQDGLGLTEEEGDYLFYECRSSSDCLDFLAALRDGDEAYIQDAVSGPVDHNYLV